MTDTERVTKKREYNRAYAQKHRERLVAAARTRRHAKNPPKVRTRRTVEEKRAWHRAWKAVNADRLREQARAYRERNKEKLRAQKRAAHLKRQASKGYDEKAAQARIQHLKRAYGLTPEQYEAMVSAQDGKCAICGGLGGRNRIGEPRPLDVDHCHETGRVRALLCQSCNRGIGQFGDNEALVAKALDYLRAYRLTAKAAA
jgi:hypothetical protein